MGLYQTPSGCRNANGFAWRFRPARRLIRFRTRGRACVARGRPAPAESPLTPYLVLSPEQQAFLGFLETTSGYLPPDYFTSARLGLKASTLRRVRRSLEAAGVLRIDRACRPPTFRIFSAAAPAAAPKSSPHRDRSHRPFTNEEIALLEYLAGKGHAYPSARVIAGELEMRVSTVRRLRRQLERDRILEVTRASNQTPIGIRVLQPAAGEVGANG